MDFTNPWKYFKMLNLQGSPLNIRKDQSRFFHGRRRLAGNIALFFLTFTSCTKKSFYQSMNLHNIVKILLQNETIEQNV